MLALRPFVHDESISDPLVAGLTFQVVLMEGKVQVEAHGFGICLRTAMEPGESPRQPPTAWCWQKIVDGGRCTKPDQRPDLPTPGLDTPSGWSSLRRTQLPGCRQRGPWQLPESQCPSHHPSNSPGPPQRNALQKRSPRSFACIQANPLGSKDVSSRSSRRCCDRRRDRSSPASQILG